MCLTNTAPVLKFRAVCHAHHKHSACFCCTVCNTLAVGVQSAEESDREKQEARQQADAQAKEERSQRAKKNAEVVAKQKVKQPCSHFLQVSA